MLSPDTPYPLEKVTKTVVTRLKGALNERNMNWIFPTKGMQLLETMSGLDMNQ
jgi:hypothetical protein